MITSIQTGLIKYFMAKVSILKLFSTTGENSEEKLKRMHSKYILILNVTDEICNLSIIKITSCKILTTSTNCSIMSWVARCNQGKLFHGDGSEHFFKLWMLDCCLIQSLIHAAFERITIQVCKLDLHLGLLTMHCLCLYYMSSH